MNEYLLQYLWNYKILTHFDFRDTQGNKIEVLNYGNWNHDAGPDFKMAKIKINNLTLVGNIELHTKSSDWDLHQHTENPEFQNIILHIVFEHDKKVDFIDEKQIPTLELKDYISKNTLDFYQKTLVKEKFIACEDNLTPQHIPFHFSEEKLLQKLDEKANKIEEDLRKYKNDYEAVLFHHLAYAFGLKINAKIFKSLAENIDFKVIQKLSQNLTSLEALFFGFSDWLEEPKDEQTKIWKREFEFITKKHQLNHLRFRPQFFRLRPPNFPTIRLSQLAMLYYQEKKLFSKIIHTDNVADFYALFHPVHASEYWNTHFNLGKISKQNKVKKLSNSFINILLLNAILPIKYAYHRHHKEDAGEKIINIYQNLKPEKNTIINHFTSLKIPIKNALDSQAYIYQHKNFCEEKKCLNCSIGFQILKKQKK